VVAFHSPQEVEGILSVLTPLGYVAREIGRESGERNVAVRIGADYVFTPQRP
jgi:hypothetical protein